ncbi:MAG: hypothetical protein B7Y82_06260 [Sphingomonadales bacterium 32-65-25]|nr:MAG: hypothetical protein B7Z50_05785 [Sphingomonadales bacterium 12-62-5]OYX78136.1 MAG: hypothetical protein B7Y82_06260 [Sphingomonadales bacterium 32-65-25]
MDDNVTSYGQCFASLALGLAPLFMLLGVAAFFGADTVTFGGKNIHGIGSVVVVVVLNAIFAALFAGLQKLGYIFLRFISRR